MAETLNHAFFYNSESGDRIYDADSFSTWLRKFFTTGVFQGDLQVTANDNMTVSVATGYTNIEGKVRFFAQAQEFTLDTADATYPRIDAIILERSDSDRDIFAKYIVGAKSTNPVPPTMVRESGIYQICLAQIYIGVGAVKITQENITDTRTNTALCGYVAGTVDKIDFSQFTAQFESYFSNKKSDINAQYDAYVLYIKNLETKGSKSYDDMVAAFEEYKNLQQSAFSAWFQTMKDQLSEDAAGHLQNEIDDANASLSSLDAKTLKQFLGFVAQTTVFNSDGSIACTNSAGNKKLTVFNADGSITDKYTDTDGSTLLMTHTTVFNTDGSIVETLS